TRALFWPESEVQMTVGDDVQFTNIRRRLMPVITSDPRLITAHDLSQSASRLSSKSPSDIQVTGLLSGMFDCCFSWIPVSHLRSEAVQFVAQQVLRLTPEQVVEHLYYSNIDVSLTGASPIRIGRVRIDGERSASPADVSKFTFTRSAKRLMEQLSAS